MVEEKENRYIEADDVRPHSSSFELKSTSKGVNVKVKVYASDSDNLNTLEVAMNEAIKRFEELREKYCKIIE